MKNDMKTFIRLLGITHNEIFINLQINEHYFDTIEWCKENDLIILHYFDEELDIQYEFDDLDKETKNNLHNHLFKLCSL